MKAGSSDIDPDILAHYTNRYDEAGRLSADALGRVEWLRIQEIAGRHLPPPPADVIDVGGGPGVYAEWLVSLGYRVRLIDPVERHVEQAGRRLLPPSSEQVGDARQLPFSDGSADAVLLLGPLYHLPDRRQRLTALGEVHRVLRPGRPLLAAAISSFASAIDGLDSGFIDDPAFAAILRTDLDTGRHLNPSGKLDYFTAAYFHHPRELGEELEEAGFVDVEVLAVESIAWAAGNLDDRVADPVRLGRLLDLLRLLEREPSLMGASPHLLARGYRR